MRSLLLGLSLLSLFAVAPASEAQANERTTLSRAEIRAMPIQERPSRPGHFYGNTVRRLNRTR